MGWLIVTDECYSSGVTGLGDKQWWRWVGLAKGKNVADETTECYPPSIDASAF